jgi:2-hydroxy-6-oxonona-2,4-dienedioate hydrolase
MSVSMTLKILGGVILVALIILFLMYQIDIRDAKERILKSQVVDTPCGNIEYALIGEGDVNILTIHGAGGGFDQGLWGVRYLDANEFRFISPSRFGYLRTPLPEDGTPAAQADAYECLLDTLKVKKAAIVTYSAGALSSAEFALRHPDRISALVLIIPDTWRLPSDEPSELMQESYITKVVLRSDFIMWLFSKFGKSAMITFFGVPKDVQANLSTQDKESIDELMKNLLPVSQRYDGMTNDGKNNLGKLRLDLENITVPTLIIDAEDVATFPGSKYTAEHIPGAKLVSFKTGGHLLVGHSEEVRAEVTSFLEKYAK